MSSHIISKDGSASPFSTDLDRCFTTTALERTVRAEYMAEMCDAELCMKCFTSTPQTKFDLY